MGFAGSATHVYASDQLKCCCRAAQTAHFVMVYGLKKGDKDSAHSYRIVVVVDILLVQSQDGWQICFDLWSMDLLTNR